MLLTFLCQKTAQMSVHGGVGGMWELLSEALKSLVLKISNIYFYIFCTLLENVILVPAR